MKYGLFADVGSTFTKVVAVDLENAEIIGRAMSSTTIATDVNIGYDKAANAVMDMCGIKEFDLKLACSSAAGGLKMVAIGLVPELTSQAALLAVQNAGAKVLASYSFMLSKKEVNEIAGLLPDIILLSGGTNGGNSQVILHNAQALADCPVPLTVIVAGNKNATDECCEILEKAGKIAVPCDNVMPEFGVLDIQPAREQIRKVFLKQIIEAKGLDSLARRVDGDIIPTPAAVLEAITLLSKGTDKTEGVGSFVAVDIGGATTDVYSATEGECLYQGATLKGLPHPKYKRSVEGDLGMRWSSPYILEMEGAEKLAKSAGVTEEEVVETIKKFNANPELLPENEIEQKVDVAVGKAATRISVKRHSGFITPVYTPLGERFMQEGKDLSAVKYIVGTGGIVISSPDYKEILAQAMYSEDDMYSLRPKNAEILLDKSYILSAMGLLSTQHPEIALEIMKKEIINRK
ncbi:MAG: glutamate mutase L [Clostridia bacterium]|nr:glutamate mutase L [Clostridia bacterium]MBQ7086944.1 glutamate mutase L [Clostridia bacterium]